ncbi:MAG: FliA/WhiG family RNA polymerase sigma factor [Myxococcales bacterium]
MHRAFSLYAAAGSADAELLATHATLIDRAARRIAARTGLPGLFDDLWSAGALGLIDAHRRFDPARDVRFESFAEHRIRGAMLDELRRMDHLPRRLRSDTDRVARARAALGHELGREPSPEELADRLGVSMDELAEIELLSMPLMPLDPDAPMASQDAGQDEKLAQAESVGHLQQAIGTLPPRLQTLLSLHYVEGLTYREIAQILEVSEPRVCQLHTEAVNKLRTAMAELRGEPVPEAPPRKRAGKAA